MGRKNKSREGTAQHCRSEEKDKDSRDVYELTPSAGEFR